MRYTPMKNQKGKIISLVLLIFGATVFGLSVLVEYSAVFQMIALGLIVGGIQILIRFVLCEHIYIIEDRDDGTSDFIVIKKQGSRETKVCHLSLSSVDNIYRRGEKQIKSDLRYNYSQNIGAVAYGMIYTDGNKTVEVIIEADERFAGALRERMGGDGTENSVAFAM